MRLPCCIQGYGGYDSNIANTIYRLLCPSTTLVDSILEVTVNIIIIADMHPAHEIQGERTVSYGIIHYHCYPVTGLIGGILESFVSTIKIADMYLTLFVQGKRAESCISGTIHFLCYPSATFIGGILEVIGNFPIIK